MSQMGSHRQLETPRPLKTSIKQLQSYQQQSFEVNSVEDLIALIETVAQSLSLGDVSTELFSKMFTHLSMHGPQLEIYSKEILDRCFIVYRNASQDDRLKISIRLNLLNLIELRANSWQFSDGLATYYKQKAAKNVEIDSDQNLVASSSMNGPSLMPGEVVKNSGKFMKPTKIPGKNYSKDEIIIRNADSGKVMGIKGRRVHIIEEMSNCVISFQRVNPGAKERLVQITGPNEESINYAKLLVEDTIKRNASPVRETSQEGSCSSLASSDDQLISTVPRAFPENPVTHQHQSVSQQVGSKLARCNSHHGSNFLNHSASVNDASLVEYKHTVNIGSYSLKITGDCLELVKAAKLVLDDFFTNDEFLKSSEFTANPNENTTMIPQAPSPFIDSGVNLDLLVQSSINREMTIDTDDDDIAVICATKDEKVMNPSFSDDDQTNVPSNGLSRSKRSHFSRKDNSHEMSGKIRSETAEPRIRIVRSMESLWWLYKNIPACKAMPHNYDDMCSRCPAIIRDENLPSSDACVQYSDVEKFLENRAATEANNIIELDDDE